MNFKEIYKAPFKLDHYVQDIAYTVDEERAFDFGAISLGDRELILDLLNGKTSLFKITAKIRYNDEAVQVFNEDTKLWDKTLLMVRGWGNLTGVGGLNMSEKEASRVQDAFGNWIIKKTYIMNLTKEQKHNLFLAWDYCDAEDKSTEFMLQYMVYNAKIEQDEVLQFLSETSEEMREDWYNDNTHLFCQHLTKLEDDGMRAVHFVQSGFRGEDGKPQWLYFVEDGVELEPYKSGIKRIDQTEMLEIYNKK